MSNFDDSATPLPPPPAAGGPFGAPPPPPAPAGGPQWYVPPPTSTKGPRPSVPVGAGLMVLGGVLLIAGSFLNWFSIDGVDFNGFAKDDGGTKDGPVFTFFGIVALASGIALFAARRVLVVVIVALVFAVPSVLAAFADLNDVSNAMDLAEQFGIEASRGPGLWVVLVGALLSVAGGVAALARTRD